MKTSIWEAMLTADMNARYWKRLTQKITKQDKLIKIFLAATSSSAVAGWGLWEIGQEVGPILWKIASGLSAIVACALPYLNHQKNIPIASELAGQWSELFVEYEDLWLEVKTNSNSTKTAAAFKKANKLRGRIGKKESKIPEDKKLLKECQQEVKRSRNLK